MCKAELYQEYLQEVRRMARTLGIARETVCRNMTFNDWLDGESAEKIAKPTGKLCPDCHNPLTYYTDDEGILYNLGDLVGRCDNPDCVSEGSTWRIKRGRSK